MQLGRVGEAVLLGDLPDGTIRRAHFRRGAIQLNNGAAFDLGQATEIVQTSNARCPELAVNAFDAHEVRSADVVAQLLQPN